MLKGIITLIFMLMVVVGSFPAHALNLSSLNEIEIQPVGPSPGPSAAPTESTAPASVGSTRPGTQPIGPSAVRPRSSPGSQFTINRNKIVDPRHTFMRRIDSGQMASGNDGSYSSSKTRQKLFNEFTLNKFSLNRPRFNTQSATIPSDAFTNGQ